MTATSRLYRKLKEDIVTCALPPGKSLSEAEIGRRYKVSRTPVREACRRLENEGLIQIVAFRGYFIAPLTVAEFHNLQEVQLIVDPAAAALAAQRANPGQLQAVEACARYEYQVGDKASYYEFLQRNRSLHVGIAQVTGNVNLAEIAASTHTRLMRYFYLCLSMDAYGPELVQEHCALVEAIKAGEPEKARQAATKHVTNTMRRSASLFLAAAETRLGEPLADSVFLKGITLDSAIPQGQRRTGNSGDMDSKAT